MIGDIIINGLVAGGMYAILAVGFALVFSVARIINISHTAFYMIAAFLILTGTRILGYSALLSVAAAIAITVLLGILCFKLFFDRVKEHQETVLIISIAVAIVFQEILFFLFGGGYRGASSFVRGYIEIAGTRVTFQQLFVIASVVVVLAGMWLWLTRTRIGKATRAVSQDQEVANLMGISVSRIYVIVMAIAAGLAGYAGALMGPIRSVSPVMWIDPIIVILAATVLGGLGSVGGAVIAAFILGYIETLVIFLVPGGSYLANAAALFVMVLILLIRPEGMFGVFFEEERL